MPHMEPAVALTQCEQALRQLLVAVLAPKHGDRWLEQVASEEQLRDWQGKLETEQKRRLSRAVAYIPPNIIDYADFSHLVAIAEKRWQQLTDALGKKVTLSLLKRFDDLRNTVAHSRELLPFEADLLAGIAG